jgi:hypothetical protein
VVLIAEETGCRKQEAGDRRQKELRYGFERPAKMLIMASV